MSSAMEELDVLVIGAGFAGIYQLDRLRDLGWKVKAVEAAPELGGIWYWNSYPGSRVDSEGAIYQFAYKDLWKDWEYTELFPDWAEVREYFAYVDRKLDISKDVHFNTRITAAHYHSGDNKWIVRASDGTTFHCTYLLPCVGFASKPYFPQIPGLEQDIFEGPLHHTGLWPQGGLDYAGKRVAVIGTGASGVQIVQEMYPDVAQLTHFQRTPNLAIPMRQRTLTPEEQATIKAGLPDTFQLRVNTFGGFNFDFDPRNAVEVTPEERLAEYERCWETGALRYWLNYFQDTYHNQESNDYAYEFWRNKTRARITNPALWEKLAPTTPPHPFGTKRPSLEQRYFEAFNQDNVELVDLMETPIQTITERGILTADGVEREFDIIVLATGFDAVSGGLTQMDIRGADGVQLRDKWATGVDTHFGVATAGFPNMLFLYGPQSPSGFCNGPTCAEYQGEMIIEILEHLKSNGYQRIEATREAEKEWTHHVAELVTGTLWLHAKSWYIGANIPGKPVQMLNYPGGLPIYQKKWEELKASKFAGFEMS